VYDGNLNIGDLRIWRARNRSNFGEKELSLLNIILPYFRNALRNIKIMVIAEKKASFWNELLENTNTVLFLFDNVGKLVFRNRQAQQVENELTAAEYVNFYSRICSLADKNFFHTQWGAYYLSVCSVPCPDKEQSLTAVMANRSAFVKIDKNMLTGRHRLTAREIEVSLLICKGLIDNEIADILGISFYTVRTHLKNIFMKTDVTNRTELISVLFEDVLDMTTA
jgi:DNA-binding CsgD family transcriptional regulator